LSSSTAQAGRVWRSSNGLPEPFATSEIRIVWGPQDDYFEPEQCERLVTQEYVVEASSDRMGARLEGRALRHRDAPEIVSDGMMLGAIQVPPNGKPIVMLSDRATTGGYPKIATVAAVDVPRLAQLLPGDALGFRAISLDEARELHCSAIVEEKRLVRAMGR
jgi:allophanate hydrolase subunit 2